MESKKEAEVRYVALKDMFIDPAYQRRLVKSTVDRLVRDLDLAAIGILAVSQRSAVSFAILDGQHRREALIESGFDDQSLECEVFKNLTLAEEAEIFHQRNTRRPVQAIELFKARVVEGEKVATEINDMAAALGWRIEMASSHSNGSLRSIVALERAYTQSFNGTVNPALRALATVTQAWGHAASNSDAQVLGGLASFYARYGDEVDVQDMANRLALIPSGVRGLLGRARGLRASIGGYTSNAVAEILVEEHNRRRKDGTRIPAWRS